MKNITTPFILISLLILLTSCEKSTPENAESSANEQQTYEESNAEKQFPEDFLGVYKGDLKITSSNGENQIPMEFHLKSSDTAGNFKYSIYYGKERSPRHYNLQRTHDPHLYLIDENNGIILESAYSNHTLYSTYEVDEVLLNGTEIFYDDRMEFMIALSRLQDTSLTGNAESAIVKNFPLSVMQRATLYKQPDSINSK